MFGIGPMELVVIVVLALLIFGPQRLPELSNTGAPSNSVSANVDIVPRILT